MNELHVNVSAASLLNLLGNTTTQEQESFAASIVSHVRSGEINPETAYRFMQNIHRMLNIAQANIIFTEIIPKLSEE